MVLFLFLFDLVYLTRAVFDTENNFKRQGETFRLLNAIKNGLANENNINKAINKILDCFYTYIPEKTRGKIYSRIGGSVAGRAITNSVISGRIATTIAGRSSLYIKFKGGIIGNILLFGWNDRESHFTHHGDLMQTVLKYTICYIQIILIYSIFLLSH
ncbi:Uncharacterised protein [Salmonella enterica subsp. enterica]|nr:Uncharacterised protein [Salmonella enterica subsp. enterica]